MFGRCKSYGTPGWWPSHERPAGSMRLCNSCVVLVYTFHTSHSLRWRCMCCNLNTPVMGCQASPLSANSYWMYLLACGVARQSAEHPLFLLYIQNNISHHLITRRASCVALHQDRLCGVAPRQREPWERTSSNTSWVFFRQHFSRNYERYVPNRNLHRNLNMLVEIEFQTLDNHLSTGHLEIAF